MSRAHPLRCCLQTKLVLDSDKASICKIKQICLRSSLFDFSYDEGGYIDYHEELARTCLGGNPRIGDHINYGVCDWSLGGMLRRLERLSDSSAKSWDAKWSRHFPLKLGLQVGNRWKANLIHHLNWHRRWCVSIHTVWQRLVYGL
jgi:hypothetical protein